MNFFGSKKKLFLLNKDITLPNMTQRNNPFDILSLMGLKISQREEFLCLVEPKIHSIVDSIDQKMIKCGESISSRWKNEDTKQKAESLWELLTGGTYYNPFFKSVKESLEEHKLFQHSEGLTN